MRGVSNPGEFRDLPVGLVTETVRWFDDQRGRVGPGVLVAELRQRARAQSSSPAERTVGWPSSVVHPEEVADWIREHMPKLVKDGKVNDGAMLEGWRICWNRSVRVEILKRYRSALTAAAKQWCEFERSGC